MANLDTDQNLLFGIIAMQSDLIDMRQLGRIVLVNSQLERLFGFDRKELLGQPIEILVPEVVREKHPAYVRRFLADPEFRPMASDLRLHGRQKNGNVFPVEISLSAVRTEQGLLVSCAVRSITSRREEASR